MDTPEETMANEKMTPERWQKKRIHLERRQMKRLHLERWQMKRLHLERWQRKRRRRGNDGTSQTNETKPN